MPAGSRLLVRAGGWAGQVHADAGNRLKASTKFHCLIEVGCLHREAAVRPDGPLEDTRIEMEPDRHAFPAGPHRQTYPNSPRGPVQAGDRGAARGNLLFVDVRPRRLLQASVGDSETVCTHVSGLPGGLLPKHPRMPCPESEWVQSGAGRRFAASICCD